VHFVVVAAPSYEAALIRRNTQFYGPGPLDWAPYRPQSPQRICVVAQSVASSRGLTSSLATAENSLLDLLGRAREHNEIVVLLIDAWAMKLSAYRRILAEYDGRNAPASAALLLWNTADTETAEGLEALRDDLRGTFPNNTARQDSTFRTGISSIESFQTALDETLNEIKSRISHSGTGDRRSGGGQ
jgi:FxsC-like protein